MCSEESRQFECFCIVGEVSISVTVCYLREHAKASSESSTSRWIPTSSQHGCANCSEYVHPAPRLGLTPFCVAGLGYTCTVAGKKNSYAPRKGCTSSVSGGTADRTVLFVCFLGFAGQAAQHFSNPDVCALCR